MASSHHLSGMRPPTPNDLEDAFEVAFAMFDTGEASDEAGLHTKWLKAVDRAKELILDFSEAEHIRRSPRGRRVKEAFLGNSVIIGETASGALVALDGSNRLETLISRLCAAISVFQIDISWIEDADDMDFSKP